MRSISLQQNKALCGDNCIRCGHCVAICPAEAISIPEYEMSEVEAIEPDRLISDIDKFIYTVKARRSIRDYVEKPVARQKLENLVQAGRYTATGSNTQGCRFVIVQDDLSSFRDLIWNGVEAIKETPKGVPEQLMISLRGFIGLRKLGTDFLFRNAPCVLFIAAHSAVDAGLAAQNAELAAIAQGLGVLYNGFLKTAANNNPAACEWLGIEDKPVQVCMLVGYPKVKYQRTAPRRAADVRWL
jgi:nitroreductase